MPKKKKNADFQKVKFKVGRKIQRATNETKAQLKVKSINIRGQFKQGQTFAENAEKPAGKKIDIKETLKHCVHRSASFRLQALTSLCEMGHTPSHLLDDLYSTHLAALLDTLGTLFIDDDAKVRAEMRKLLKLVMSSSCVRTNDVAAFFSLLVARLCCAMTHLHEDIRLDSIHILDILLEQFPALVASYAMRLLLPFINLISRPRQFRADASGHRQQKPSATLIVNPNSQMSTQKWRVRVIERVGKLFDAIASNVHRKTSNVFIDSPIMNICENESVHCFVEQPNAITLKVLENFSLRGNENNLLSSDENSSVTMQSWIHSLVPLVIDCWVESGLNSAKQWEALSGEALSVARGVLSLLLSLFDYVSFGFENSDTLVDWLANSFVEQFRRNFMSDFPCLIGRVHSAKKRKYDGDHSKNNESTSVSINLSICLVMSFFLRRQKTSDSDYSKSGLLSRRQSAADRQPSVNDFPSWHLEIINYIVNLLEEDVDAAGKLNSEQMHRIYSLVTRLTRLPISSDDCKRLVKSCCETASRQEPLSWQARAWFDFLFELLLEDDHCTLNLNVAATKWIASLPRMFLVCGAVNDAHASRVLTALLKAGSRQYPQFLASFDSVLNQLLDPSFVKRLKSDLLMRFVELFNWVPCISAETFKLLATLSMSCLPTEVVRHLLGVLEYRYETSSSTCFDKNLLFLLMQTIIIRATKADLQSVRSDVIDGMYICCNSSSKLLMRSKWTEQLKLIEHVFNVISMMPNKRDVLNLFAKFFQHILMTYHALPLVTASSIVVSIVWLRQNQVNELDDMSLRNLLTGLCVGVASKPNVDRSALDAVDSDEELWRPVGEVCADMVCHYTALIPTARDVISRNRLNESFVACLTARIPKLTDSV